MRSRDGRDPGEIEVDPSRIYLTTEKPPGSEITHPDDVGELDPRTVEVQSAQRGRWSLQYLVLAGDADGLADRLAANAHIERLTPTEFAEALAERPDWIYLRTANERSAEQAPVKYPSMEIVGRGDLDGTDSTDDTTPPTKPDI